MPEYKKKKKHYMPLKRKKYYDTDDVKMKSDYEGRSEKKKKPALPDQPRVIKGKKQVRIARLKVISVTVGIVLAIIIVLRLILPVGLFESASHYFKTLGVGDYPIQISGNEVINVDVRSDCYYLLTDSDVYSFNKSGKLMDSFSHGFSNPVISTSFSRAMIYDQGKKRYDVFVNGENRYSNDTEENIICGDISDSGVFAVATYSKSYASSVSVFNSGGSQIFNWNSANDIINSIVLSDNGKKLAVSTVNSVNGKKVSNIYIFNFKSTDSESTVKFENEFVYDLVGSSKGFFAVLQSSYSFINWNNKEKTDEKSDYNSKFFKSVSKRAVAVFTREDNDKDNIIYCIDKNGYTYKKFNFNGNIKDISFNGNRIFVFSDGKTYLFNDSGENLGKTECNNIGRKIAATGNNSFCIISDDAINSYNIK